MIVEEKVIVPGKAEVGVGVLAVRSGREEEVTAIGVEQVAVFEFESVT